MSDPASVTTMNATNDPHDPHALLSVLLSSTSLLLTYSVPLIFASFLLASAGAFLILDRTRSFTPRDPSILPLQSRRCPALLKSLLGGGVGGIAGGFTFGVHFATFLSLLVPNTTNSPPLSPSVFVAVFLLSGVTCALLAGKWKYAALTLSGITGFASLSLALSVMLHPGLLTRIILTAITTILGTILCLIPLPKYRHVPIRFAASSAGSFGLVLCIALLSHIPAWGDVWSRLWVGNDIGWGTVQEKGLSAAYCFLLVLGATCDWFLHRQLGQNPDEKWDHYLADYGDSLPNDNDRAGLFEPSRRIWDRLFNSSRVSHSLLPINDMYGDHDTKSPPGSLLPPRRRAWKGMTPEMSGLRAPIGLLRQPQRTQSSRVELKGRRLQFGPTQSDSVTYVGTVSESSSSQKEVKGISRVSWDVDASLVPPHDYNQHADVWMKFWHDVKTRVQDDDSSK